MLAIGADDLLQEDYIAPGLPQAVAYCLQSKAAIPHGKPLVDIQAQYTKVIH